MRLFSILIVLLLPMVIIYSYWLGIQQGTVDGMTSSFQNFTVEKCMKNLNANEVLLLTKKDREVVLPAIYTTIKCRYVK